MEIKLNTKYGFELVYEAENVKVVEDIETRINGGRDIEDSALNKFSSVLNDLIYHRNFEYDSCELIERLFEKLPENKRQNTLKLLIESYATETTLEELKAM